MTCMEDDLVDRRAGSAIREIQANNGTQICADGRR